MPRVSRAQARAFLVQHYLLDRVSEPDPGPGPATAVARTVARLGYVQVDPMVVVERNHELALHARLPWYRLGGLEQALYEEKTLVEALTTVRCIVPAGDLPYFRPVFRALAEKHREQLTELAPLMAEIKDRLGREGPLSSRDLEHDQRISGWWDADGQRSTRAARQALEWLWHFGEVMVARREGQVRYFDLTERLYPGVDDGITLEESRNFLAQKYFLSAGLSEPGDVHFGFSRHRTPEKRGRIAAGLREGGLAEVEIHGVPRAYYVPSQLVSSLEQAARGTDRVVLLPPLDNFLINRRRLKDIFDFEYTWEAYTRAAARRYGPYAMPVLYEDTLVARVDARADRGGGTLVVNGIWWEEGHETRRQLQAGLEDALHQLGRFIARNGET